MKTRYLAVLLTALIIIACCLVLGRCNIVYAKSFEKEVFAVKQEFPFFHLRGVIDLALSENQKKPTIADEKVLIGKFRITEYCKVCNTPRNSTATASGRWVPGYSVASSDIALGTIIYIDGFGERRVDDTGCPKGTIDLLIDSNGECKCDLLTNKKVWRR